MPFNPKVYQFSNAVDNSNCESGLGPYDLVLIPENTHQFALSIEFKSITKPKSSSADLEALLAQNAEEALAKIESKLNRFILIGSYL